MENSKSDRRGFFGMAAVTAAAVAAGKKASAAVSPERKAALVKAIRTVQAYQEVANALSRFMTALNYRQADAALECFALKQADVSWEFADEGVFRGPDVVRQIIKETITPPKIGEMLDQTLLSPGIEIADDLKTARAWWRGAGFGAIWRVEVLPGATWNWDNFAADLIYEDDAWKLWHAHSFRMIKCHYEPGWGVDTSLINRLNIPVHPLAKPSTYHNPFSPLSIREAIPAVPTPYQTWTDSSWMLERDKSK
jgi:hypothetical protein